MTSLYEQTGDIKDVNTMLVNRAELRELQRDAAKWRAMLSCARVRPLGSAGCERDEEHNPDYAHIGFELWTHYNLKPEWVKEAEQARATGKRWLERFVEKVQRLQRAAGVEGKS
jgi:hypothetical protein